MFMYGCYIGAFTVNIIVGVFIAVRGVEGKTSWFRRRGVAKGIVTCMILVKHFMTFPFFESQWWIKPDKDLVAFPYMIENSCLAAQGLHFVGDSLIRRNSDLFIYSE